ncbi:MAG: F0F1 ATP synthase subunit B [Pseudomonadota bacterium]|nr:F0F1 ATP synthase subunit B [Pseudomonadota bacterium]
MDKLIHSPEFWVAIGFVILIGVMAWLKVGKMIGSALDARADKIKASLDEAAELREEAQHVLAEYQRKQRDAIKEMEEMLVRARDESKHLAEEAAQNLGRAMERREEMARDKIAQAEAEALQEVREIAVDVALAAARKLITDGLDEARAGQLLDAAIAELPDKVH